MSKTELTKQDEYWLDHVFSVYNNHLMCLSLMNGNDPSEVKAQLDYSSKQMNKLKNKCKRICEEQNQ